MSKQVMLQSIANKALEAIAKLPDEPCDCEKKLNAEKKSSDYWHKRWELEQAKNADLNDHLKGHIHTIQELEAKVRELKKKLLQEELDAKFWKARWKKTEEQRGEIAAELSTIREQGKWELGEPLEPGYLLQPETRILKLDSQGKLWQMEWQMKINIPTGWICYLDPRPLPTLPEPVPEVPKFKGAVRNVVTGKIYYVLWPKGARPSLVSPDGHTLHYDGFPPNNHELYNHPEVPNTPELIAALEKKST